MSALDRHQRPLYLGLDVGIDGAASTEEHLEITDAVNGHEPEKARKLMVKHIAKAEERIVAALRARRLLAFGIQRVRGPTGGDPMPVMRRFVAMAAAIALAAAALAAGVPRPPRPRPTTW